ncbi:hypothetical protein LTR37_018474 [Vermiconidia calcicola]|uniref:Uncharacterized protein n=1 Tax=Vermiconidia calcicola TaxID=1690605 RepID=A0ACC3MI57_9PEZI|nr:hypothetical protein LTR37_018474 [Vermiconidia calcicola]
MSKNDPQPTDDKVVAQSHGVPAKHAPQHRSLFSIPAPLKRVFDQFPLVTYAENELPLRTRQSRDANVLHLFTTDEDAEYCRPSFNPACLKWQTHLKLLGVPFRVASSSNHASPSGALPFLLPATPGAGLVHSHDPVPSSKLKKWLASQTTANKLQETSDVRCDAYVSMLDGPIRKAWLYQLYLNPANSPLVHRLYVEPSSSNPFVQMTIAYQLRRAAETELVKASHSDTISEIDVMHEARQSLEALSTLLGHNEWFFAQARPSLFDASVFAYTHLILNGNVEWGENRLAEELEKSENLVRHQQRIFEAYS